MGHAGEILREKLPQRIPGTTEEETYLKHTSSPKFSANIEQECQYPCVAESLGLKVSALWSNSVLALRLLQK